MRKLWKRKVKGLIGVFPVRDDAEGAFISSVLSEGVATVSGKKCKISFRLGSFWNEEISVS
ncbi:hypothetical protein C5167_010889 [Papaver somniferum]|uniref:Uncharacterized protein n=1 Tax=Papaver somniferum TaxID=3469 RepID=A0A4Y7K4S6_PAPSO|nr:hypothetical protein C5167_010889 [Papaver somniferum]